MNNIINQIVFRYWNNQIEREQMLQHLQDVPSKDLAEWINDLLNRIPEAMRFATQDGRMEYDEHRDLPESNLHERIPDAATRLCPNGSMTDPSGLYPHGSDRNNQ